jgi:hypothetical protein
MTQTAVSRIWRAFGLKPHKVDYYWKLSTTRTSSPSSTTWPGCTSTHPQRATALRTDEEPNIHALDHSAPAQPMMPPAHPRDDMRR